MTDVREARAALEEIEDDLAIGCLPRDEHEGLGGNAALALLGKVRRALASRQPECVLVSCTVCHGDVCPKEDCETHPDGCELLDHRWVCSRECYDMVMQPEAPEGGGVLGYVVVEWDKSTGRFGPRYLRSNLIFDKRDAIAEADYSNLPPHDPSVWHCTVEPVGRAVQQGTGEEPRRMSPDDDDDVDAVAEIIYGHEWSLEWKRLPEPDRDMYREKASNILSMLVVRAPAPPTSKEKL